MSVPECTVTGLDVLTVRVVTGWSVVFGSGGSVGVLGSQSSQILSVCESSLVSVL